MLGRGGGRRTPAESRGQTETIGVVLVLAMTLVGATIALAFGATALNDARVDAQEGGIEHAMTQLDSRTAMVALGDSSSQRIRMASSGSGGYHADPDAGRIIVTHHDYNGSGVDEEIYNETLGALVYERGDKLIAYQGGGVWRAQGSSSTMVSPPEFHYQSATLTLPVIRVDGTASAGGSGITAKVTRTKGAARIYPSSDTTYPSDEPYQNPVREGNVTVTVESDYYQAWAEYFRTRTSGEVTVDDARETVSVKLISIGASGTFAMPADGNAIEIRGLSDGHPIDDFNITLRPDDADAADFSNLQWSLYEDQGSQEVEIHLRAGGNADVSGTPCKETYVEATIYYSDKNGDPYHGWHNATAFRTECDDLDGDGDNESYVTVDLTSSTPLEMQSLSSSQVQHFSPGGEKLVEKANFSEHASDVNWEPKEFEAENETSIGNLTNHYLSLMGPNVELTVKDKGSDSVNEGASSGNFYQIGGTGRFITFLHITENQVRIEFE